MKKLFDFIPVDIVPFSKGFIYAKQLDDEGTIAYYSCDFKAKAYLNVTKGVYLLNKFGPMYKEIAEQIEDTVNCDVALLENGDVFLVYDDGEAGLFDCNATLLWIGDLCYHGEYVKGATANGNNIWCIAENENSIIKYSPHSKRFELRLGSKYSSAFVKPSFVSKYADHIYVCSPNEHKICSVNLINYEVDDYRAFNEPVYRYYNINGNEVVVLNSGVYLL
ncbi:MAG: hypothetical protein K5917_07065 [Clostridiales bacterium]|nr:hypothetical protein [Clostridiales bacterium]